MRAALAGILSLACLCAATESVALAAPDPGAPLLAHRFVDDAYNRSRAQALPPELLGEEAEILLQAARTLQPDDLHTLKLLVEAAALTGNTDLQRDALRNVIRLDPGDLVAQVQYIDLIASGTQAIDERSRVYQAALDKTSLDPQIRSEMAVRLARISAERADIPTARAELQQALQLNDVNVGALRELVRLAKTPEERLRSLVALLTANPLQPDAWVEMGQVLDTAGLQSQAAEVLATSLEQMQIAAEQPPTDVYLEYAIDLVTAGRRVEAAPILQALAKLPDAPLSALVAAHMLNDELQTAGTANAAAATQAEDIASMIRTRLAKAIAAAPTSPRPLADAIWIELSAMTPTGPDTIKWIDAYDALVPQNDPARIRFQGWRLYREGKLAEAQASLEKSAPADPLAQLGLVRVLIARKNTTEAAKQLQDLWWTHPTGLLGFQVAQTARAGGIPLTNTLAGQQLLAVYKSLPPGAATAHREARDLQLISASLPKRSYDCGEPVIMTLRINNTTDHALPVGPDGIVKTTIGLTAKVNGPDAAALGIFGVDDLRRVYRLERRATIEGDIRVDRGILSNILDSNYVQMVTVTLGLITAPHGNMRDPAPSLGGQRIPVGDFSRRSVQLRSPEQLQAWLKDLSAVGPQQLIDAQLLAAALRPVDGAGAPGIDPALRSSIVQALTALLRSPSAVTRAWVQMVLAQSSVPDFANAVAAMSADADPLVRMEWARQQAMAAEEKNAASAAAADALKRQADAEQNPLAKRWMNVLLKEVSLAPPAPKGQTPSQP